MREVSNLSETEGHLRAISPAGSLPPTQVSHDTVDDLGNAQADSHFGGVNENLETFFEQRFDCIPVLHLPFLFAVGTGVTLTFNRESLAYVSPLHSVCLRSARHCNTFSL